MSFVYVVEDGAVIGINAGTMTIKYLDDTVENIPKDTIQGVAIYGKSHMTAHCIQYCLENDIKVSYFSHSGTYYGRLAPINNVNTARQRLQCELTLDDDFCLDVARRIIYAKINNQLVVAKRYLKMNGEDTKELLFHMRNARRKVMEATSINQIMGYEGIASRNYFKVISMIIEPQFAFDGRSRRPARDPFNAMLNFGYSILSKEIYGHIENKGMNAYFGFLHKDKERHPCLASDMIEEWRAPIVDATVLSLIQGHEVDISMFDTENEDYCKISRDGIKELIRKLEMKMYTEMNYLEYIDTPVTFRKALWHQADRMAKMIDHKKSEYYKPVIIK